MKKLTIQEVIKAIPLDGAQRKQILEQYTSYTPAQQFAVTKIAWDAFLQMQTVFEAYWQEKIMQEVAAGTRVVEGNMAQEVRKKVWMEIEDRLSGKQEDDERLTEIRGQLEKMMDSK